MTTRVTGHAQCRIQEGLLSENVKSHLFNKIKYINLHFLTFRKDTVVFVHPHSKCIYIITEDNMGAPEDKGNKNTQLLVTADKYASSDIIGTM